MYPSSYELQNELPAHTRKSTALQGLAILLHHCAGFRRVVVGGCLGIGAGLLFATALTILLAPMLLALLYAVVVQTLPKVLEFSPEEQAAVKRTLALLGFRF